MAPYSTSSCFLRRALRIIFCSSSIFGGTAPATASSTTSAASTARSSINSSVRSGAGGGGALRAGFLFLGMVKLAAGGREWRSTHHSKAPASPQRGQILTSDTFRDSSVRDFTLL